MKSSIQWTPNARFTRNGKWNVILFDDVAFSSLFFEILETKSYNINF